VDSEALKNYTGSKVRGYSVGWHSQFSGSDQIRLEQSAISNLIVVVGVVVVVVKVRSIPLYLLRIAPKHVVYGSCTTIPSMYSYHAGHDGARQFERYYTIPPRYPLHLGQIPDHIRGTSDLAGQCLKVLTEPLAARLRTLRLSVPTVLPDCSTWMQQRCGAYLCRGMPHTLRVHVQSDREPRNLKASS
jgi:hypothetical protein